MNEIEGMFHLDLYDKVEDKMILGRDFMGRLPSLLFDNIGLYFQVR